MKKEAIKFLQNINKQVYSNEFMKQNRYSKKDFTRKRKMHFPSMILFMLNTVKQTLQKELTNYIKLFSSKTQNITKSAFCQSRMKLKPEAFISLNNGLMEDFYTDNDEFRWKSFRLLAIDGSIIQVPASEDTLKEFGRRINKYGESIPMAKMSTCYDVLNNMFIDAEISSWKTHEYDLALKHLEKINDKNLFIYDRNYGATWFMSKHTSEKKNFLIRMQRNSINEVRDFFNSNEEDKIVEIKEISYNSKQRFKARGIKFKPFKIRLVKVVLDTGEVEVLATSLLSQEKYPTKDFKDLYWRRWGIEIYYDNLKNNLQLEDFTGLSSISIRQDIFASMFVLNLQSIFIREAEDELKREKKQRKYNYKINKRVSIGFMKDSVVKMIGNKNFDDYVKLKKLFKTTLIPIRPNRKNKRLKHSYSKKFFMNQKRAV